MIKLKLRDFANLEEHIVLRWLEYYKSVEIEDDEGNTVLTDTQSLMLTWQGLSVHRAYNEYPYHVNEVIKVFTPGENLKVYDDKTLAKPLNNFLPIVMRKMYNPVETDGIKMLIHIWTAKINNLLTAMTERYAISVSIDDVIIVMDDPGVKEIKRKVMDGEVTIDEGERLFIDYVRTSPTLDDAYFAVLCRTGGTNFNQAYQTIICRGATFDLNKSIFPNAIKSAFADGIVNLADSLTERNSAGISLVTNGKALQNAEWFHRKNHLYAAVVRGFNHEVDCHSQMYVPIKIDSKEFLHSLLAKHYLSKDGTVELIDNEVIKNTKIGDVIMIRSIAYCHEHDPSMPCGICAGQLKTAFPYNTVMMVDSNTGIYSGTAICKVIGQDMLSVKHLLRNTTATPFIVFKNDRDLINSPNGDDILLNKELCVDGTKLIVTSAIIKELTDIRSLDTLDDLTIDKLSYFEEASLSFVVEDIMVGGVTVFQRSVKTAIPSRAARMSKDLLEFIFDNGWEVVDKKFISIDLSNWSDTAPLFTLPYTHEDMDIHRREVESFMNLSKRNDQWKEQEVTPERFGETLVEFWKVLNNKFKGINIMHCEVLLFSIMTKSPKTGYYGLVNGDKPRYFTPFQQAVWNRGFGTVMIFDHQQVILDNFQSFLVKQRQPSPLEAYWQLAVRS